MMSTKIEWVDETWNPITGCTKTSEGCTHCYAERMARRLAGRYGYLRAPHHFDVTMHEDKMEQPLRWKRPRRVFVCSMGDLFHKDVDGETVDTVFGVMAEARQHTFLVLTKRVSRMLGWATSWDYGDWVLPNIWLGVTAENQKRADERIPILLQIPAAGHFVSLEPLLSNIDLKPYLQPYWNAQELSRRNGRWGTCVDCPRNKDGNVYPEQCKFTNRYDHQIPAGTWLNHVIVGGESGPGARPMHPEWARWVRDQCQESGTPFLFKGWGAWVPTETFENWVPPPPNRPDSWVDHFGVVHQEFDALVDGLAPIRRVGKKAAGRLLDGREWDKYP